MGLRIGMMIISIVLSTYLGWIEPTYAGFNWKGSWTKKLRSSFSNLLGGSEKRKQIENQLIEKPEIGIYEFFTDVLVFADAEYLGWKIAGHLDKIAGWSQGKCTVERMEFVKKHDSDLKIVRINSDPLIIDSSEESRRFFSELNAEFIPFDGNWIGFKYVLYPHIIFGQVDETLTLDEPMTFYLVREATDQEKSAEKYRNYQRNLNLETEYVYFGLRSQREGNLNQAEEWYRRAVAEGSILGKLALAEFSISSSSDIDSENFKIGMKLAESLQKEKLRLIEKVALSQLQYSIGKQFSLATTKELQQKELLWKGKASRNGHMIAKYELGNYYFSKESFTKAIRFLKETVSLAPKKNRFIERTLHICLGRSIVYTITGILY